MQRSNFYILTGSLFLLMACSKGGDEETLPENNPNNGSGEPVALSYTADIAPIMNANCVSCHGDPPTQGAPMALTTLDFVKDAVTNRNLLGRINSTSAPMPPAGRMPQTTRDRIAAWIDQGMPQ